MPDDYNSDFDNLLNAEPALTRADVRQEVGKALADIAQYSAQTQAGVQHAVEEVSTQLPDFRGRISAMQQVLRDEPVLRDAIQQAEANPSLQTYLTDLYRITYKLSSQAPGQKDSAATERPESPRPSGFSDEVMYEGALASQRFNLSAENRKRLIQQLENAGVLDVEF